MAQGRIAKVTSRFEWFVASRYLRAKRREAVISLVTAISVAGVAAGVMALVIALAVNNGFRSSLERNLLGATPHVVLLEKQPSSGIANWRPLCEKLGRLPHVVRAYPALYGKVLASGPMQSAEATVKGTPLDAIDIQRHVVAGSLADVAAFRDLPGIVLGVQLARRTGMNVGDVVKLISPQGEMTPFGVKASEFRFRVAAKFESGFYDLDNQFAFTTVENAQRLFLTGDVVNSIELRIDDLDLAPDVARAAEQAAGPEFGATNWMEQNRQLLSALRLERTVSVITIGLIQLVAALNILTALVMSVMDKRRDIAVMISMGARRVQVARIFVTQGLLIGLAGSVIGLVAGYGLSFLADRYRWIGLDEEIYSLSYVPFEPHLIDAAWITAMALAVSLAATLYPARSAAKVVPVETLRYE